MVPKSGKVMEVEEEVTTDDSDEDVLNADGSVTKQKNSLNGNGKKKSMRRGRTGGQGQGQGGQGGEGGEGGQNGGEVRRRKASRKVSRKLTQEEIQQGRLLKLCDQVRSLSLFRWRTLTLLKI